MSSVLRINQFSVHSMSIQSALGNRIHWSGYCAIFVCVCARKSMFFVLVCVCFFRLVGADFYMDALTCHPSITNCTHHQTHVCDVCECVSCVGPFVGRSVMFVCFTPAIFCMKNRQNVSAATRRCAKWMMMCRKQKINTHYVFVSNWVCVRVWEHQHKYGCDYMLIRSRVSGCACSIDKRSPLITLFARTKAFGRPDIDKSITIQFLNAPAFQHHFNDKQPYKRPNSAVHA